jgi:acyl dehydratase
MCDRYFEEYAVGETFETGIATISEQDILAFARAFDPQPWHLDGHGATKPPFYGLVASGWHTTAIAMRLLVDCGFLRTTGVLGIGIDELRWPRSVRPGSTLRVRGEVRSLEPPTVGRRSGTMRVSLTAIDQNDEAVLTEIAILRVLLRPLEVTLYADSPRRNSVNH